jgi:hypothetical protein
MSTNGSNPGTEQHWQQPDFGGPALSGQILLTGETSPPAPQTGTEEQRLRLVRRLIFPIVLVGGLITGLWWQFIAAGVITAVVLRRRIWQLTYQRMLSVKVASSGWQPADLR